MIFYRLFLSPALREKCPNTEFFSVLYFPIFSPYTGKYGPEKLRIRILFTQCRYYHQKRWRIIIDILLPIYYIQENFSKIFSKAKIYKL